MEKTVINLKEVNEVEEKKRFSLKNRTTISYMTMGSILGLGFLLGMKYQKSMLNNNRIFMNLIVTDISFDEVKEILKNVKDAKIKDALIVATKKGYALIVN